MFTDIASQRATLYYKEGSSDKVYQAAIEPSGDGFVVNFSYGRRGSAQQTGCKTPKPVDHATARKVFDKLVQEKMAKGYTPGEEGTPYQSTPKEDRVTGIVPQLLNPIEEAEALALVEHADWLAQEKLDGRRVLVRRINHEIIGINRQGLVISLPQPLAKQALSLGSQQWLIDGELVGEIFWAFDLLESASVNFRTRPYAARLKELHSLLPEDGTDGDVQIVETARSTAAKRKLVDCLQRDKREGVVFKRADSLSVPGRPASGGSQLKWKFTASASCIVAVINGRRRSVQLQVMDDGKRIAIGNVTIPPNFPVPEIGSVADVRYLYAYPGGSLYQPVYLGIRQDLTCADCILSQLKLKPADSDESA